MATKAKKTEHAGPKNRGRKSGFWGPRAEAKSDSRKRRRTEDRKETDSQLAERRAVAALESELYGVFSRMRALGWEIEDLHISRRTEGHGWLWNGKLLKA